MSGSNGQMCFFKTVAASWGLIHLWYLCSAFVSLFPNDLNPPYIKHSQLPASQHMNPWCHIYISGLVSLQRRIYIAELHRNWDRRSTPIWLLWGRKSWQEKPNPRHAFINKHKSVFLALSWQSAQCKVQFSLRLKLCCWQEFFWT